MNEVKGYIELGAAVALSGVLAIDYLRRHAKWAEPYRCTCECHKEAK